MLDEISQKDVSIWAWLDISIAFFWRNCLILMLCSVVMTIIFGLSIIMEKIHIPELLVLLFIGITAFVSGFFLIILQLKWFFRAKFKGFRIAIVKHSE